MVPDADEFAGARELDVGVGAQNQLPLAAGQNKSFLGTPPGQGGRNLIRQAGGFIEHGQGTPGGRGG